MIKKTELLAYARWGVRRRLEEIERMLAGLHHEFPDLFLDGTAPVFVRPETKPNGASAWPTVQVSAPDDEVAVTNRRRRSEAQRAAWTPARRVKAAKAMKKRSPLLHAARRKKAGRAIAGIGANGHSKEPWGFFLWQRMHDFLQTQDQHTASLRDILVGAKANVSASVVSAVNGHPDYFKRVGVGRYHLKKVKEIETAE